MELFLGAAEICQLFIQQHKMSQLKVMNLVFSEDSKIRSAIFVTLYISKVIVKKREKYNFSKV